MKRIAILCTFLLLPVSSFAQTPKPRPALTGDIVKDTKALIDNSKNNSNSTSNLEACNFNLLASLKANTLLDQIHNCIQTKLFNDVSAALDSATAAKDQVGIACLQPGLAIIKAAKGSDAVPATDSAPAVAAIEPGPILLFQKFREFELAGGPAACKTWVNSTIAGANPLTN